MADKKCSIVIQNESGDTNQSHKYFAYFVDQEVSGGQFTQTLSPVFFVTDKLKYGKGRVNEFNIFSQLFAICAIRKKIISGAHPIGSQEEIELVTQEPVHIGRNGDDGSSVVLRLDDNDEEPDFKTELTRETADNGCFNIICDNNIPRDNPYVVGLARRVSERHRPVAIVPCVPGTKYKFRPKEEMFIERCKSQDQKIETGTIVPTQQRKSVRRVAFGLRFGSNAPVITVDEKPDGFYINKQPGSDTASLTEETEYDRGSGPAQSRAPQSHPTAERASPSEIPQSKSTPRPSGQKQSNPYPQPSNTASRKETTDSTHQAAPEPRSGERQAETYPRAPTSQTASAKTTSSEAYTSAPGSNETRNAGGSADESDEAELALSRLGHFHTVFVVDDTGSMLMPAHSGNSPNKRQVPRNFQGRTRWDMVVDALQHITDIAVEHDEAGIDVHFLVRTYEERRGVKNGNVVRDLLLNMKTRRDFKNGGGPTKFVPVLKSILNGHVRKYRKWDENRESGVPKPRQLDLIVLTDGEAKDKLATRNLIIDTAKALEDLDAHQRQVGIQFIQVGDDEAATRFLKELDDDIKNEGVRDIVDTRHYDNPEGKLPLKEQLAKMLLGAMDDDIDNAGE